MKKFLSVCLVVILFSCGGKQVLKESIPCSQRFESAKKMYVAGEYYDAKEALNDALYKCSGSKEMSQIIYYLGMSYYNLKKYDQAEYQFRDIVRDFHSDSLAGPAQYMIGKSLFKQSLAYSKDQKETRKALEEFNNYLEEYKDGSLSDSVKYYLQVCSDKIVEKEFKSGQLYMRMQEYKAAQIYFKGIIKNSPESKWETDAKFQLAICFAKDNNKAEALLLCDELIKNNLNDKLKVKVQKLAKRLRDGK